MQAYRECGERVEVGGMWVYEEKVVWENGCKRLQGMFSDLLYIILNLTGKK